MYVYTYIDQSKKIQFIYILNIFNIYICIEHIDQSKKIQLTMKVAEDSSEFVGLKLLFDKESKKYL